VTDIDANGDLLLEGNRQVSTNGNLNEVVLLSGKVRLADIRADRTVASRDISELSVERIAGNQLLQAKP
jgi:flagellar basal body L-ring protein FlgH